MYKLLDEAFQWWTKASHIKKRSTKTMKPPIKGKKAEVCNWTREIVDVVTTMNEIAQ